MCNLRFEFRTLKLPLMNSTGLCSHKKSSLKCSSGCKVFIRYKICLSALVNGEPLVNRKFLLETFQDLKVPRILCSRSGVQRAEQIMSYNYAKFKSRYLVDISFTKLYTYDEQSSGPFETRIRIAGPCSVVLL